MNEVNHRARVAALRRERMRARLMDAALTALGRADLEGSVIDEVIRRARVSRGTFYNYFRNPDELLEAVAVQAGNELMHAVAPVVDHSDDPAERVSAGVRSWITLVDEFPELAAFLRRAGLFVLEAEGVRNDLSRDLAAGIASKRFSVTDMELGFVLVAGTVLAAINTLVLGSKPKTYGSKLAQRILMSLGIDEQEAASISRRPIGIPKLPPDALIARSGRSEKGE